MLQIDVVMSENYDEELEEFVVETQTLKLEHSLVSLSKWESKYEKPFLSGDEKTEPEILDYITMMALDEVPPEVFRNISEEQYLEINAYINAKMTATWFNESVKKKRSRQTITSELIYYWIASYEIPWEVETWHLSRLFTLLRVFNAERSAVEKPNKSNSESLAAERRALNEKRKREMGTTG